MSRLDKRAMLACVLLVLGVVVVFGETARHDFVNFDDDRYVYDNEHIKPGLTLRRAWLLPRPPAFLHVPSRHEHFPHVGLPVFGVERGRAPCDQRCCCTPSRPSGFFSCCGR